MFTLLFLFMIFAVFGKIAWWGVKATWGLTKLLLTIVFLPFMLIGLFLSGAVAIALPILIVFGIIALLAPKGY